MKFSLSIAVCLQLLHHVSPHVRMMDPPARNVLWRSHPELPEHKDDDYLICYEEGSNRCPPCGDNPDDNKPYPHQAGGQWARGIIDRNYTEGETMSVKITVTNSHGGHMEFKLCPNNDVNRPVTQQCLDKYPLDVVGYRNGRVPVTAPYQGKENIKVDLVLPKGVTCQQCVVQMSQYTEQFKPSNVMFRNCADIGITKTQQRNGGYKQSSRPRENRYEDNSSNNRFSSSRQNSNRFPSANVFGHGNVFQTSNNRDDRRSNSRTQQRSESRNSFNNYNNNNNNNNDNSPSRFSEQRQSSSDVFRPAQNVYVHGHFGR